MGCIVDENKPNKNCAGNDSGSGTTGASGDSGDPPGQCEDWDPDGLVAFNRKTRAYEVDQQLIDDLQQKPLIATHGLESYRTLLRGGFDVEASLGLSLEDLVDQYNRDAAFAYPRLSACTVPEIAATSEGVWQQDAVFSCESQDATQYERRDFAGAFSSTVGAAVHRTIELEEGTYDFQLEGGESFTIEGCLIEPLEDPPDGLRLNGDVFNEVERAIAEPFAVGQVHRLRVTEALYRVTLSSGTEDEAELRFSATRVD